MANVLPFKALTVKAEYAKTVSSPPYDVLNTDEARTMAADNKLSFLHVSKSEIDLPSSIDDHSEIVYTKAAENFKWLQQQNVFTEHSNPVYFVYRLVMNGISQTGLVVNCTVDDYFNDVIKKHEYTRPVKENDRIRHTEILSAQSGPVFSVYKDVEAINQLVDKATLQPTIFDFTADDGVQHIAWQISDSQSVNAIQQLFLEKVPAIYIADGHHRAASYSKLGKKLRESNNTHSGYEDYNQWLSVLFPASQTSIMDYNRVVKDLNGLSEEEFLQKLSEKFVVEKTGNTAYKPMEPYTYGLYINKCWYKLIAKPNQFNANDVIDRLDITLISRLIFADILNIQDQRTDTRIDFVGGIRGMSTLEKRVDSGEMKAAFSIPAVSIQQLIEIADSGKVMPPKTTWFEPKLRDGLFIHQF